MSLPKALRAALVAFALSSAAILAGCTLTPVYGEASSTQAALRFTYAEPNSRLEQILYQTLADRLGRGFGAQAPQFSASVSVSATRIGLSAVASPVTDYQLVATVTYRVTSGETVLASGTRRATAGYQTTGQIVSDDSARANAEEQAVRAAAEQVRLALIADLTPQ